MLVNLVGNAVKFTDAGGVTVRAALTVGPGSSLPLLRIEVADTGIGLPEDMYEAIFESFRQADDSTARRFGGTGLGLAISRELARLMGGDIQVQSTLGKGSRFLFTASCVAAASRAQDTPPARAASPHRTLRILVAEDNPVNIKLMSIHLNKLGHTGVVATSGEAALALLAAEPFDLVLMDVEMPAMDGLTAARAIRAGGIGEYAIRQKNIPIIAVTAHVSPDVRQACAKAGMDDYVAKPVNLEELSHMIDRLASRGPRNAARSSSVSPADGALSGKPADGPADGLDVAWAMRRLGIERELYEQILATSLGEFQKRLDAAGAALASGDKAGVRLHAHTLKSIAATMGAGECLRLAVALEQAVADDAPGALRDLLARLALARDAVAAISRP